MAFGAAAGMTYHLDVSPIANQSNPAPGVIVACLVLVMRAWRLRARLASTENQRKQGLRDDRQLFLSTRCALALRAGGANCAAASYCIIHMLSLRANTQSVLLQTVGKQGTESVINPRQGDLMRAQFLPETIEVDVVPSLLENRGGYEMASVQIGFMNERRACLGMDPECA